MRWNPGEDLEAMLVFGGQVEVEAEFGVIGVQHDYEHTN